MKDIIKDKLLSIDWDFKDSNTTDLSHSLHPYHAKFIPQIPYLLIKILTREHDSVLDPFCGSGTTLVEALRLKRRSVGVDNSPLSCLLSKVKTTKIQQKKLETICIELLKRVKKGGEPIIPDFPDKGKWFTFINLNDLGLIWKNIDYFKNQDLDIYNFFRVVFSSILKTVANYKHHWNWTFIGDNVLPDKERKKIDVFKIFERKLQKSKKMLTDLNNIIASTTVSAEIFDLDARKISCNIPTQFNLMVTSPPYPCAVDFNRYYRLTYYWFGWNVNKYRDMEIGARSKRGKKDVLNKYKEELVDCISEIYNVMKRNSYSCFVIGDTQRKKEKIDAVNLIKEICKGAGFNFYIELNRKISKQSMAQKRIAEEKIIIFTK